APSSWGAAPDQNLVQQIEDAAARGNTAQAELMATIAMHIKDLPAEVVAYIAQFLDPKSFIHAAAVNRFVRQMPLYRLLTKHKGDIQKALFDVAQHGTPDKTEAADITI